MSNTPKTSAVPRDALRLGAVPFQLMAAGDGEKPQRNFAGVANAGKPMAHWYWDQFVLDMGSVQLSEVTPGLIEHNPLHRAAVGKLAVENHQLTVTGHLLSNEHGQALAQDADEGFPLQMSVWFDPGSVEKYEAGTTVQVNGQTLSGPIAVMRGCQFHEFTFTPIGVDTDTEARVLSRGDGQSPSVEINEVTHMADDTGNNEPTVESLQAQVAGMQQQLNALQLSAQQDKERADNAEEALQTLRTEQRGKDVRALLSAKGVEYSDEAAKPYLEMDQAVFDAVAAEVNTLSQHNSNQGGDGGAGGLPPIFFQSDASGAPAGSTQLSGQENPLVADAKARAGAQA